MKICLDPGHGRGDNPSPAVAAYREGDQMFRLALHLKKALEDCGAQVILTRNRVEEDPDLWQRARMARGCDLLLSLHSNAAGSGVYESVDYVAVFYHVTGQNKELAQDLSEVIGSVMGTRQASQALVRWNSAGNADYYGILRNPAALGIPALLLEHSFHTNTAVTKWLLQEENLETLARAEAAVIAEYYGLEEPEMRYELLKDIKSPVYRPTVEKLLKKGLLTGRRGTGEDTVIDLGEDALRLLVILDRAGHFDGPEEP